MLLDFLLTITQLSIHSLHATQAAPLQQYLGGVEHTNSPQINEDVVQPGPNVLVHTCNSNNHTHAHTNAYTYTHIHANTHTQTREHTQTHTHTDTNCLLNDTAWDDASNSKKVS